MRRTGALAIWNEEYAWPLPTVVRASPDPKGRTPLLVFLHGHGEAAPTPLRKAMTRHGPLRATSSRLARGFLVIAPQKPDGADDWHAWRREVERCADLALRKYSGEAAQQFLTGFSYGANGVLAFAASSSARRWAGFWAVDPTQTVATPLDVPLCLYFGRFRAERNEETVRNLAMKRLTSPKQHAGFRRMRADHVPTATRAYKHGLPFRWLLHR